MSCPPFRVAILWSTYDDEGAAGARAAILLTRGTLMADGWRMEQHRWVLNYALFSLLNMFMTVSRSKLQRGAEQGQEWATSIDNIVRAVSVAHPLNLLYYILYALEAAGASSALALSSARGRCHAACVVINTLVNIKIKTPSNSCIKLF